MASPHTYLAAFDLDKTVLSVNSSKLVVQESRKMNLMSRKDYRQAIYYSLIYKFDLKDANEIVVAMMQWLRGLKESEVSLLAEKHAVPVMLSLIRPEIISEIDFHRKNNARIIMLSSALPYLCNPVARHLGMDDIVCSRIEVRDGLFTGRSTGKLVFGPEKAVRMRQYCSENNFSLDTAWYYGDAYTDRFVMQAVGNPVAVKPEIKLGWLAKRKGWRRI